MAVGYNPRIVTDGLVLALDAANAKGYDSKENRILHSEDLTQWGNTDSVATSNTQIAPNGTLTADEVYATSTTQNRGFISKGSNTGSTFAQNSWHTFSVHWKAGTSSGLYIQLPWNDGGNAGVVANFIESGGEVSVPTVSGYGNYESGGATVEKLDNGWYRFSITFRPTSTPTGAYIVWLFPSITSGGDRTTNTTSYIWGAQTEVGQSVTTYVKTEASNKIRGTTWSDLSGKGNNGTLDNSITYTSSNGGGLSFDGTDELVSLSKIITTSDFTVCQFITPISDTGEGWTFEQYNGGIGRLIINTVSSFLRFFIGGTAITTNITLTSNQPYFICCSRTGSTGKIYINGNLNVSGTLTSNALDDTTCSIGGSKTFSTGKQFIGDIYTTSVYNRALSAAEIQQNFNALRGRFGI